MDGTSCNPARSSGQWLNLQQYIFWYDANVTKAHSYADPVVQAFTNIRPSCGTTVHLSLGATNNPELTGEFIMTIMDYPAYYRAIQEGSTYYAGKQKAREIEELEKAKKSGGPRM